MGEISLNNNLLIVPDLMVTTVATVVLWTTVSNISEITVSVPKNLMDIPLETDLTKLLLAPNPLSPSPDIKMLEELMDLKKPVTNNQFLLLLMPKIGLSTVVV